jgi:pSer/pThr/pTyr-binding forkhead associated (FHA) protein
MPNPYLQIEAGAESKRYELEIGIDDVTIGRSTDCQWVISSGAVSRRHARITRRAGDITVEDLGSSNGTFVNGERLSGPKTLRDQDAVKFGSVEGHFFAPPAIHEADATIAISGEEQATILAPPTMVIPPPVAESLPESPTPEEKPASELSHATTHPPIPTSTARSGTGTHTVVPEPPTGSSEAGSQPNAANPVHPPAAAVAVPPATAEIPTPPPVATVAVPPPAAGAAEANAPSETVMRPAPSPPAASQAIRAAVATPGRGPSIIELAVIAGASFLVVFGIGAMLIRFVF